MGNRMANQPDGSPYKIEADQVQLTKTFFANNKICKAKDFRRFLKYTDAALTRFTGRTKAALREVGKFVDCTNKSAPMPEPWRKIEEVSDQSSGKILSCQHWQHGVTKEKQGHHPDLLRDLKH